MGLTKVSLLNGVSDLGVVYVGDKTFAQAVTDIGSTVTTLVVDKDCAISTAVVVPSTLEVRVQGAGKFTKSGSGTITFNGAFSAEIKQVFFGFVAGDITGIQTVYVAWWGNDAASIQSAISAAQRDVWFSSIQYAMGTTQISITGKGNLSLLGTQGTELQWTDFNGIGMLVNGASSRTYIDGIKFNTTNIVNPQITLLKFTGNAAYERVTRCEFSGAKYAVYLAQTYIGKFIGNDYAGCECYIYSTATEGSNTDILIQGETFGTTNIGTTSTVYLAGVQNRLVGCYFETMATLAKWSVEIATGAQQAGVTGCQFANSGGVIVRTSATGNISGNTFYDCDNTANAYVIRIDGGATGVVTGNSIDNPTLGTTWGIGASGTATVNGNFINKCAVGISIPAGSITGNTVTGCTTGIQLSSGSLGVACGLNHLSGNTTDINNAAGTNIVTFNYATNVTESATTGAYFGNAPKRAYAREYYGQTTYDPPSLATGVGATTTVTVSNASVGDFVEVGFSNDLQGITVTGYVSASNTVSVRLQNNTGGTIDLASGTLYAKVRKAT